MIFRTIGLRLLAVIGLLLLLVGTPAVASAHPEPTPPPKPQNPRAADGASPGVVTVSWDALSASESAFYRIGWVAEDDYRAVTGAGRDWLEAFAFVDVANQGQTSHTISRLTPGINYAFIVGSISERFGTAAWSEWARLTLAAAPVPTNPNPSPPPTSGTPDQPISSSRATGRYTQISAGKLHTCGVRQDGTIDCWGANGRGQSTPPEGEFLQVSAGGVHSCGVKVDSTIVCWGSSAVPNPPANQKFAQVSTGDAHACGITVPGENENPRVACWGAPGAARTDNWQPSRYYTQIPTISSVSSGENHNCALYNRGGVRVHCWGGSGSNQLTSGTGIAITAGGKHTCYLRENATVRCEGSDTSGQSSPPAAAEGAFDQSDYTYSAITAGTAHTCAIDADGNDAQTLGAARCWGSDSEGQSTPPVGVFTAITAGGSHTCGLRSNGTVSCWGDNTYRQAPSR